MNNDLRQRWLAALRASTTRAHERECDYARSEGDVDRFDPIGLLAVVCGDDPTNENVASGWYSFSPLPPDAPLADKAAREGQWLSRHYAESYAREVGFPVESLPTLCALNDVGAPMGEIADWIESVCQ